MLAATTIALVVIVGSACGVSGTTDEAGKPTTTSSADRDATSTTDTTDTTETTEAPTTTSEPTPPASGSAVPVEQWTGRFCRSFTTWLNGIKKITADASTNLQTASDVAARKQVLLDSYASSSALTDTLITDIEGSGPPDVARGDSLKSDILVRFRQFSSELSRLIDEVRAADPSDASAFASTVTSAAKAFQANVVTIGTSFSEIDTKYPDPAFQSALRSSCAGVLS